MVFEFDFWKIHGFMCDGSKNGLFKLHTTRINHKDTNQNTFIFKKPSRKVEKGGWRALHTTAIRLRRPQI